MGGKGVVELYQMFTEVAAAQLTRKGLQGTAELLPYEFGVVLSEPQFS